MARIGQVPEIIEVKKALFELKSKQVIKDWELPYENLLTRLTAAIFFVEPNDDDAGSRDVWDSLRVFPEFRYRENREKKLSQMKWRVEFSNEDGSL